eukprot:TRINITY_DN2552_c0_g1_i1.p1 TRINITY_DN2552_c0_g1~~TRINITY_DN2552_c0_g1_i1.p1  ORF type:complete len:570 (+),score=130.07 TRINITY_DN2552_c0_g1_i1:44-1753(+)
MVKTSEGNESYLDNHIRKRKRDASTTNSEHFPNFLDKLELPEIHQTLQCIFQEPVASSKKTRLSENLGISDGCTPFPNFAQRQQSIRISPQVLPSYGELSQTSLTQPNFSHSSRPSPYTFSYPPPPQLNALLYPPASAFESPFLFPNGNRSSSPTSLSPQSSSSTSLSPHSSASLSPYSSSTSISSPHSSSSTSLSPHSSASFSPHSSASSLTSSFTPPLSPNEETRLESKFPFLEDSDEEANVYPFTHEETNMKLRSSENNTIDLRFSVREEPRLRSFSTLSPKSAKSSRFSHLSNKEARHDPRLPSFYPPEETKRNRYSHLSNHEEPKSEPQSPAYYSPEIAKSSRFSHLSNHEETKNRSPSPVYSPKSQGKNFTPPTRQDSRSPSPSGLTTYSLPQKVQLMSLNSESPEESGKKSNIRFVNYHRERETIPNVTVFRPSELLDKYAEPSTSETSPFASPSGQRSPTQTPQTPTFDRTRSPATPAVSRRPLSIEEKYEAQYQKHLLCIQKIYDSIPIIGEDKALEELERERQRQRQRDYRKRLHYLKLRNQTPEEKARELEKRWHTHY